MRSPMTLKEWSEVFYNFAVGLAAIAGVWFLIPEFKRWFSILYFRRHYRPKSCGKRWELIGLKDTAPVYVHDLQLNLKRHVANPATMVDLRFDWNSIRIVSREELDRIRLGSPINTEQSKRRL